MNPIAKQNLNRLINHNVLLGAMVIISCLQVYNYIRLNKVSCIFIFLVTFILSFQAVSKNITISLFLAIFVANFLLGCASFMEGHTVMVHTPFQHEHKAPIDQKMIPGFDKSRRVSESNSGVFDVFREHISDAELHPKYNNGVKKTNYSLRDEYTKHYNNTSTLSDTTLEDYLGDIFSGEDKTKPTKGYGKSYDNTSSQGYCLSSSNCGEWHYKSKCCVAGCCDTACAEKNCN